MLQLVLGLGEGTAQAGLPFPEDVGELEELPPIETRLTGDAGAVIPVHLHSHITEVGTLEMQLVADQRSWKLEGTGATR